MSGSVMSFLRPGAGCCDPWNEKALRAGRGAAFKLPLAAGDWPRLLDAGESHGLRFLAAQPPEAGKAPYITRKNI